MRRLVFTYERGLVPSPVSCGLWVLGVHEGVGDVSGESSSRYTVEGPSSFLDLVTKDSEKLSFPERRDPPDVSFE